MSTATVTLFPLEELPAGTVRKVEVGGVAIAVVRIDDDVYAIGDVCSHADVSLSGGEVWCEERELECPQHGSAFNLVTGEPSTLPATRPVPVFDASVLDGQVVVTVSFGTDAEGTDAEPGGAS